ncbi:MAG TPA: PIN domain-containing protein [Gemmatimonadaceae bacterium]|nr:PIN domain-containing protein [Gemmatimonadaceae bacterium]
MMVAIVLDTNVLIAGLRSPRGASFELLRRIGSGAFELNVSVPLVLEYEAVAKRHARELGLGIRDIDDVLDYLCSVAQHRQIFYLWRPVLPDSRDDLVLELAVEAGAECIVTHNLRDFGEAVRFGVQPITPREFLRRLRSKP